MTKTCKNKKNRREAESLIYSDERKAARSSAGGFSQAHSLVHRDKKLKRSGLRGQRSLVSHDGTAALQVHVVVAGAVVSLHGGLLLLLLLGGAQNVLHRVRTGPAVVAPGARGAHDGAGQLGRREGRRVARRRREQRRVEGGRGRRVRRRGRRGLRGARRGDFVAQDATDGADGGHVEFVADAVRQQPVADLPRENSRVLGLQLADVADHSRGGDAGLAAPDGARQDRAGLVVARQNFGHAAVRNAQLPRNVARSDAQLGKFDDAQADGVGQWSPVHEHAAQLVHLTVLLQL